jgi:3-hydroxyacyl-[acyl-carrier-protein] dehydratase
MLDESLSQETQRWLAHRRPFLFVDSARVDLPGGEAWSSRTFTDDDLFFGGHFPGDPVVPGVILLELIAQTANCFLSHRANRLVRGYLVGVDDVKFNASVRPHQTVTARVRLDREVTTGSGAEAGTISLFKANAYVGDRRCTRGSVSIFHSRQPGS